jgi:aminopeptidase N
MTDEKEFWGVRSHAADALGKIRAKECEAALVEARDTKHPKVRRAVVRALGRFKTPSAAEALKPKALRDASYLVEAEAARSLGKTRQTSAYDVLLDVVDRKSWAEVIATGAIDGLAALRDERALPHLYARTRYGHPTRVRRASVLAIPKLSTDRRAREHLEELVEDNDPMLRIDVVRALQDLGDAKARAALRARAEVDLDARVRRRIREVLRDLGSDKKQNEQLKDDLEKLQSEHRDLKARLATIEARLGGGPKDKKKKSKRR